MEAKIRSGIHNVSFDWKQEDPGGDIPITGLGSTHEDGLNLFVGLSAGSAYTPGMHEQDVTVVILEGSGLFHLNGNRTIYAPFSVFKVPKHTEHGFVKVKTDTLFIKQVRFGLERKTMLRSLSESFAKRFRGELH